MPGLPPPRTGLSFAIERELREHFATYRLDREQIRDTFANLMNAQRLREAKEDERYEKMMAIVNRHEEWLQVLRKDVEDTGSWLVQQEKQKISDYRHLKRNWLDVIFAVLRYAAIGGLGFLAHHFFFK